MWSRTADQRRTFPAHVLGLLPNLGVELLTMVCAITIVRAKNRLMDCFVWFKNPNLSGKRGIFFAYSLRFLVMNIVCYMCNEHLRMLPSRWS